MAKDKNLNPIISDIRYQRTYVMVKPDGVVRGLTGDILYRIEKAGLKIVAIKMVTPTKEQAKKHYPYSDEAWVARLGEKTLGTFDELNLDKKEFLGSDDKTVVGQQVADSLVDFLSSGPVVCMVIEGVQAIEMVRKLAGHTLPIKADVGTIRGDYSVDSPAIANIQKRPLHNIMHASENPSEAENEIKLWFNEEEIQDYDKAGDSVMFSRTY